MMVAAQKARRDWVDIALLVIFMIGIYTHYTIQISASVPFPSAISGLAGMAMLWRMRDEITSSAFVGIVTVVLLYALSILFAEDLNFLGRRLNGLIQITYSLTIGFALFLTVTHCDRAQVSRVFFIFAAVILVGCLLEDYAGLGRISDMVREKIYSSGVYEADTRDQIIYGRVRPKFFASEPSAVTLTYTICVFCWLVTSVWRWRLFVYLGMIAAGAVAMPGPTLLLLLLLLAPYELFFAGDAAASGRLDVQRMAKVMVAGLVVLGAFAILAETLYSERLHNITEGSDPSFFFRVLGPPLATQAVIAHHPIAGAGLTGEPAVENEIVNAYVTSPSFSRAWQAESTASDLLINYFWMHWIYLGLVWGVVLFAALSAWLSALGVRRIVFCWMVWAILGQASGAYVGPITWAIFFLAAASAHLASRVPAPAPIPAPAYAARASHVRWRGLQGNAG